MNRNRFRAAFGAAAITATLLVSSVGASPAGAVTTGDPGTTDHAASGSGQVTTVGTVPDDAFARSLRTWLVPAGDDAWRARAVQPVTVLSATSGAGRRLRFVHNWSWQPTTVAAPAPVTDALSGTALAAGDDIELGAWDVRVLVED